MPVTISGTTGIGTPAINATGNIQAAGNIVGTGICPVGVVLPFALATTPTGWLACDGTIIPTSGTLQGVNAALLQTLRGLLGTTYGATGQLPNLQGQFIRGLTTNLSTASRDPLSGSRLLGNVQGDAIRDMVGEFKVAGAGGGLDGIAGVFNVKNSPNSYLSAPQTVATSNVGYAQFQASNVVPTDVENRPVNIALLYCIKY
jgi:hypothetical protein